MSTLSENPPARGIARTGDSTTERWCALLQCLVREGGALTPDLDERMRAAGLDLDQLRDQLQHPHRRRRPASSLAPVAHAPCGTDA